MPASGRPNILFILTDQHRYDCLGSMGHPLVKTPHLDALAAESVIFDAAYTAAPICGPARGSLFTGMYPPGHGEVGNWVALKSGTVLLTDRLAEQGYWNALVGKLHLSPCIKVFGFHRKRLHDAPYDIYEPEEPRRSAYMNWLVASGAFPDLEGAVAAANASESMPLSELAFWQGKAWTDEARCDAVWAGNEAVAALRAAPEDRPFFLNLSFFGPHHPYAPPPPWDRLYDPAACDLPPNFAAEFANHPVFTAGARSRAERNRATWGEEAFRRMTAAYLGQISMIDAQIGRVLEALRASGRWDETLIVFTADHGDHMGARGLTGKGDMYETSVRVPMLVKPAGGSGQGRRCARVVNTLDLFGTFCAAAGDRGWRAPNVASRDISPLLAGPATADWNDETYSIIGADPATCHAMLRRGPWKLSRKGIAGAAPAYELHEPLEDPWETRNLCEDPACAAAAGELQRDLDAWLEAQAAIWPREIVRYQRQA